MSIYLGAEPRFGRATLRVLITGAGAGIGFASARAFAEQGAELILSDVDGPSLERATTNFGGIGRFCDVASEASVAVFAAEILKSFESLDVLINAAGRSYVRTLGTMRITRAFLPMMKSDGAKKDIVNIAPLSASVANDCPFPYAASKEAFDRLTEALAENVRGTKVGLTTIVPRSQQLELVDDSSNSCDASYESIDAHRVAAAIVSAVRSARTASSKPVILPVDLVSEAWNRRPRDLPRPRLVRKPGGC